METAGITVRFALYLDLMLRCGLAGFAWGRGAVAIRALAAWLESLAPPVAGAERPTSARQPPWIARFVTPGFRRRLDLIQGPASTFRLP
jgi:hypothetical protein